MKGISCLLVVAVVFVVALPAFSGEYLTPVQKAPVQKSAVQKASPVQKSPVQKAAAQKSSAALYQSLEPIAGQPFRNLRKAIVRRRAEVAQARAARAQANAAQFVYLAETAPSYVPAPPEPVVYTPRRVRSVSW